MDNYFGLGFVLNVVDNASSTFGTVGSALQNLTSLSESTLMSMSMTGMALNQLGTTALNAGTNVMSGIIGMGKQVISVGDDFEKTRITLNALYGSAESGEKKLKELVDYAARTPFEITSLKDIITSFKALGVEILGTEGVITTSTGKTRQFIDVMSDLASLNPSKPFNEVSYAIKEYVTEGNKISLFRRLGLDIQNILGSTKALGTDIKSREQDVADLVAKLGAEGLTDKMFGTWSQMFSNLKDQATQFFLAIADGGAFNSAKATLKSVSDAISSIGAERLAKIGMNIAQAFSMIWAPIDFVVNRLLDLGKAIASLVETNPIIAKLVVGFIALSGTVLIGTGLFFKLFGSIMMAMGGIGMLLVAISEFGGMTAIFASIRGAIGGLIVSILPMIAVIGSVFLAWKYNFLGIRDMSITFVKNTRLAFQEATRIARLNSQEMGREVDKLSSRNDFFSGLTLAIIKVQVLWTALCDAWNDNALSDENFEKVQKLGLLPLLSSLLDLKYNFEQMWKGYKQGYSDALSVTISICKAIGKAISSIADFLSPVINKVLELTGYVNSVDSKGFEAVGYALGVMAQVLTVYKIGSLIFSIGKAIWTVTTAVGGFTLSLLTCPITWIVLGVVALIAGIVALITHWDDVKKAVVGFVTTAKAKLKEFGDKIYSYIGPGIELVKSVVKELGEAFSMVFKLIKLSIEPIKNTFMNLWNTIKEGATKVVTAFKGAFNEVSSRLSKLVGVVAPIFNKIKSVATDVINFIIPIINKLKPVIEVIVEFFKVKFELAFNIAKTVWGLIFNTIVNILGAIYTFITTNISNLINVIGGILSGVIQIITGVIELVWGVISNVIGLVYNIITGKWSEAFDCFIGIFTSAWQGLKDIFGGLVGFFSSIINGVIDFFGSIGSLLIDIITSPFKGAWSYIKSMFEGIKEIASGVFDWFSEKFSWVTDGISSISSGFSAIGDGISGGASAVGNFLGFATGAEIYGEGAAVLHPGEVVVNGDLTSKLRTFLNTNTSKGSVPLNNSPVQSGVTQNTTINYDNKKSSINTPSGSTDNSITFNSGAIQITMTNGNDTDISKLVKKIATELKKNKQINDFRNYQTV